MSLSHKFKERFRLLVEAAVRNVLDDYGYFKKSTQGKLRNPDEQIRFQAGCILSAQNLSREISNPVDAAYQVYSQFDEDGIIEHLIRSTGCNHKTFVEIGVEDYRESNTRYLLERHYWSGVTIDSSNAAQKWMDGSGVTYRHDIRHLQSFVTRENINELLDQSFEQIDVLSIDVDGNDYFIWEATADKRPKIVVIEYNPILGAEHSVTIPYQPDFSREKYHFSKSVFGASIQALIDLASRKGYTLVAISNGPNAFFVANECLGGLKEFEVNAGTRLCAVKEQYDSSGQLRLHTSATERLEFIKDVSVLDLRTNAIRTIKEIYSL